MSTSPFDAITRSFSALTTRRHTLRRLLGAGTLGILPAALLAEGAAAFKSLSGCKKHCNQFDGSCHSDCNTCCKKVVNGNQKRCSFGCGTIHQK